MILIDSLATPNQPWYSNWLLPATIIAVLAFLFTLFKYWRAVTMRKPAFTYFSRILSLEGEHFVVKIASSYAGPVHFVRFYGRRLRCGFIPLKKFPLGYTLKDEESEAARFDSQVQRTTFRDEQLFWVTYAPNVFKMGSKYRIVASTSVGRCSINYSPRLRPLSEYFWKND